MSFVLDASTTMAWLFEDERNKYTDSILMKLESEEAFVPDLWLYEVANVLIIGERRKRITEAQSRRFSDLLYELPINVVEIAKNALWGNVLVLAREHGLTAYDAAYLELAMHEGLPVATQDKALRKASKKAGIETL